MDLPEIFSKEPTEVERLRSDKRVRICIFDESERRRKRDVMCNHYKLLREHPRGDSGYVLVPKWVCSICCHYTPEGCLE